MSSTPTTTHAAEDRSGLAAPEVLAALTAIDGIRAAPDAASCLERLFLATQAIGATAGLYLVLIPELQDEELSSITLLASDSSCAQPLFTSESLADHPWVRFARTHTTAATDTEPSLLTPSDAAALDIARAYGFDAYLLVPTMAGRERGRVELLCLGRSRPMGFDGEDQRVLRMLAYALAAELHDWFKRQLRYSLQQATGLRSEDLQLLALEWEGLGTKDIALRTGLSMAAVDSRFQRLNDRLNCNSRRAAARRAAEYGLLDAARSVSASSPRIG